ncbi:MAG TPA: S9 family peptidase, partial [Candidatus Polarisedimenticolia bacterium]|nr:S9 family peptidase [Candidatus Polarisedimenticolia bacterium]
RSGEARSILKPAMQIGMPRWSPDGTAVAFIGGLMSDEPIVGGEIFVVSAEGGEARNLTPDLPASATWLAWLASPERILFAEQIDGESGIATVAPGDGRVEQVWRGAETITAGGAFSIGLSPSRDGRMTALIRHSFRNAPEVWAGPIGAWRQVTRTNDAVRPPWGEARSLHWSGGRWEIQGWLIAPLHPSPETRAPLIVLVHGGPVGAVTPTWPAPGSSLALAAGYFVLVPNPRGSLGKGEAFVRAVVRDFGHGDLDDILNGVDEAVRSAPIDPQRVGITGWSYGGFMTMWAVTRTERFRAAVAGAGVANWQSYYGQNGIDQWMIPFFGASVYDDPKIYARSSPINFVKNVRTPTLVLVGERDIECPPPQSFEFYKALKTLGVETGLVVYPDEGHIFTDPGHRRDRLARIAAWFDAHLR